MSTNRPVRTIWGSTPKLKPPSGMWGAWSIRSQVNPQWGGACANLVRSAGFEDLRSVFPQEIENTEADLLTWANLATGDIRVDSLIDQTGNGRHCRMPFGIRSPWLRVQPNPIEKDSTGKPTVLFGHNSAARYFEILGSAQLSAVAATRGITMAFWSENLVASTGAAVVMGLAHGTNTNGVSGGLALQVTDVPNGNTFGLRMGVSGSSEVTWTYAGSRVSPVTPRFPVIGTWYPDGSARLIIGSSLNELSTSTNSYPGSWASHLMKVGVNTNNNGNMDYARYIIGHMDSWIIYDRGLTQGEMEGLAEYMQGK